MKKDRLKLFVFEKLVGAGFSFSLIIFLYTFFYQLTLFDLSKTVTSPWLWAAFYVYGILWSSLVDLLVKKVSILTRYELFLYLSGGIVIFVVLQFELGYILIAGSIGALAAFFFYIGKTYITRFSILALIFALISPLLFFSLTFGDFTKKRGWEELTTETSFAVNFTYFNGEHRLPIVLQKGEKLIFSVNCKTEAAWGYYVKDEQDKHVPLMEEGEKLSVTAEEAATFHIVIEGSRAQGKCFANWQIN